MELFPRGPVSLPPDDAEPPPPEMVAAPLLPEPAPPEPAPPVSAPPVTAAPRDPEPPPDAPAAEPDPAPVASPPESTPPPAPVPIVAVGAVAALPRLGVEGGDPRLGVCRGGVVVGVRTTANPSTDVFGQRLTFVEPICGTALEQRTSQAAAGSIRVLRDDALIAWSTTDGFFGDPTSVVPDSRLIWVPQPETVCPEATPVVVGLAGEFDPVAPDVPDTAAIRSLFIECAPLELAPDGVSVVASAAGHQLVSNAESFAAPGTENYRSACEDGRVTTQIQVHAGFWLDGFVLGCSGLRVE